MKWNEKNVLVTGGNGFLGERVVSILKSTNPKNLVIPRSIEYDLRKRENCAKLLKNVDVVFHLAGMGKGIGFTKNHPGSIFYDTLIMDMQLMEEAKNAKVEKFISAGTVNSYPEHTKNPFKEIDIWSGLPEQTNAPFGIAKRMQILQSQMYKKEYDFDSTVLILSNLYGSKDNFDLQTSNVIPALIMKMYQAKMNKNTEIEIWGDGTPTRDFIHVDDAARAFVLAAEHYTKSEPVNIGSGVETSIKDLANMIMNLMKFELELKWNLDLPKGHLRRVLDITRAKEEFNFSPKIELERGLEDTINWHVNSLKK